MKLDFTLIDCHFDRGSTSWFNLLNLYDWNLFYLEIRPKHSGGGISRIELFGTKFRIK